MNFYVVVNGPVSTLKHQHTEGTNVHHESVISRASNDKPSNPEENQRQERYSVFSYTYY